METHENVLQLIAKLTHDAININIERVEFKNDIQSQPTLGWNYPVESISTFTVITDRDISELTYDMFDMRHKRNADIVLRLVNMLANKPVESINLGVGDSETQTKYTFVVKQ